MAYKRDQGRVVRMAAFWSLAALLFFGAHSGYFALLTIFPAQLGRDFLGVKIPVLGLVVTPALLIATLLFCVGLWLLYRWLDKPKYADALIETEAELRKVTWPTMGETINSSVVVILTVGVLMVFLAGSDWVLGRWATYLLTGGN
jgi:preprotein translocase SecE subunit